jgi:chloramphenicol-sensitive protein RarD
MTSSTDAQRERRRGGLAAASAFLVWGLVPIYFKALSGVSAGEVVAQRVLWSVLLLAALLAATRNASGWQALRVAPRRALGLLASALCITINWAVFVWAVNDGRVLETSLGYYINPLATLLLGIAFLRERLKGVQWLAVALAAAGVGNQVWQLGQVPWVSLALAGSFALYTLLRKQIAIDAMSGLFIETLFMAPLAAGYLLLLAGKAQLGFGHLGWKIDVLLALAGVITALPLVLFAYGARRLRLATMGFIQYIAPSMTFLLAIFVFGEPFGGAQLASFAFIWAGLAVYSLDAWRLSVARNE